MPKAAQWSECFYFIVLNILCETSTHNRGERGMEIYLFV